MKIKHLFFLLVCVLVFLFSIKPRLLSGQIGSRPLQHLPGVPAGFTIIDGDIQVPISLADKLSPQATIDITRFWPNGGIPFRFEATCVPTSSCTNAPNSGCVSAANQTLMTNAMAVLENMANIDFQECAVNDCTGTGSYIRIRDSTNDTTASTQTNMCLNASANNSPVGMQTPFPGGQVINIVSWGAQFIMAHELLHSLGFFHEHQRADRGSFVQINCNNVQAGCNGSTFLNNFPISNAATAYGYYDFDSVMHYGQCSFSINGACPTVSMMFPDGGITICVLAPHTAQWQNVIGQRARLSALDSATLSFIYPQGNWRFLDTLYNGSNGQPDGSFLKPFTTLSQAVSNTPVGGTIWILRTENISAIGTHSKQLTFTAAPGVIGTLGN